MGSRSEGKRSLWRETVWILAILEQAVRGIGRMRLVPQTWKLALPICLKGQGEDGCTGKD